MFRLIYKAILRLQLKWRFWYAIDNVFKLLTPNVNYSVRTAPLNSKVAFYIFIQQI